MAWLKVKMEPVKSENEATLYTLKSGDEVKLMISLYVDDLLVT